MGTAVQDLYTSHPKIELFSRNDGNHASGVGSYFFVLVSYGCIYGPDPGEVTWVPRSVQADWVEVLKVAASRAFRASKGLPPVEAGEGEAQVKEKNEPEGEVPSGAPPSTKK